jgi:5-deoxy-D-glucuronate isomerase
LLVVVLLVDECSLLELPSGELTFELEDDDERSVVLVAGATGSTTTGAGAITTGSRCTTSGAGAVVVVVSLDFEVEVSVESANTTAVLPNSIARPKDKAAVLNECFMISSSLDIKTQ